MRHLTLQWGLKPFRGRAGPLDIVAYQRRCGFLKIAGPKLTRDQLVIVRKKPKAFWQEQGAAERWLAEILNRPHTTTCRKDQRTSPRSSLKTVTENLPNDDVYPFNREKVEIVVRPTHENGGHGVMRDRRPARKLPIWAGETCVREYKATAGASWNRK